MSRARKGKGHGTKFIEMLEKEAKRIGESEMSAFPVTNDKLEHIMVDNACMQ